MSEKFLEKRRAKKILRGSGIIPLAFNCPEIYHDLLSFIKEGQIPV